MSDLRNILETSRVVAVLGAHKDPGRPAFYVPDYLHAMGYRVLPVNPMLAGSTLWGEPVRSRLDELTEPVDLVDVFRRAELLPAHLEEILAMKPLPRVVWLQQGIVNQPFADSLAGHGIEVIQDRCTLADHRALGIAKKSQ